MRCIHSGLLFAVLVVCLAAPAAHAQLPFSDVSDMRAEQRRYTGEVLRELDGMMKAWRTAWDRGDDREIAKMYAENAAVVLPDRTRLSGRDEIEQRLRTELNTVGPIQTGITDFELGGTLAFSMGWFTYDTEDESGYHVVRGRHIIALRRQGRSWRVLTQVFVADPPPPVVGA